MASEGLPRLLTVRELSAALGVARWRIHELCAKGQGPPFMRVGKTYRFPEDRVAQWIAEQVHHQADPDGR